MLILHTFVFTLLLGTSLGQGCGQALTGNSGTFQSPNYPSNYYNGVSCVWTISADPGTQITLTFSDFDLERGSSSCPYDYVRVRDGGSSYSSILAKVCGSSNPGAITSTGNTMYIEFRSDYSVTRKGFVAAWTALEACGQALTGNQGVLQSPNFPNSYDSNSDCMWTITTDPNTQVTLRFDHFDVTNSSGCFSDYFSVYDGNTANRALSERLCGNETPPFITSSGNSLLVRFRSRSNETSTGFSVTWSTDQGCQESLVGNDGELQSPNYPLLYPHNSLCNWTIRADPGTHVTLYVWDLDIELSSLCILDQLAIYDGSNSSAPNLGRICGNRPIAPITTTGNTVFLQFRSNLIYSSHGFRVKWTTGDPVCGQALTAASGTIQSPNYPNTYPDDTQCLWTITAPSGSFINLTFTGLDLPNSYLCQSGLLEVRDGNSEIGGLSHRYCGGYSPAPVISTGNVLYLFLYTRSNSNYTGFQAQWSFVQGCGGTLNGNTGFIQSPNYPSRYDNNENCVWIITTDPGTTPTLHFLFFSLEGPSSRCPYDYVEIRDGSGISANQLAKRCGSTVPGPVTATGNVMYVKFRSDGSVTYSGFRAQWSTTGAPSTTGMPPTTPLLTTPRTSTPSVSECGGVFFTNNGYIQSINYPLNYPNSHQCTWTITTEPGTLVRLIFLSFILEGGTGCPFDYVAIYNGNSSLAEMVSKVCGISRPNPVIVSGNSMYVRFRSDGIVTRPGFRALWTAVNATEYTGPFSEYNFTTPMWHPFPTDNFTTPMWYPFTTGSPSPYPPYPGSPSPYPPYQDCGHNMTGDEGSFRSPNHPYPHHHDAYCVWDITTAPGTEILLTFTSFLLEGCYSCGCDRVVVRDGNSMFSNILASMCGSGAPRRVVSTGNALRVEFVSDGSVSYSGFQAYWFAVNSTSGWNETDLLANVTTPSWNRPSTTNVPTTSWNTPSPPPTSQPSILPIECQRAIAICASQFWSSSLDASNFCSIMVQYMQCVRSSCPFVPDIPAGPSLPIA